MNNRSIIQEVIVHPVDGMQLSEGRISCNGNKHFRGSLPGIEVSEGDTIEEVRRRLEEKAKAYYGNDVVVEITPHIPGRSN